MLTIENITVAYKKGSPVLENLSLTMETSQIHGLVGLNGSGKTTLLNTLYGYTVPAQGQILYNGLPLKRRDIAYLEAENYFYPYMTAREYLSLFPEGEHKFNVPRWQQRFALPPDEITENYSTGMRKKLAILAVLKQDKPIIILDEPFNGLDLEGSFLLTTLLQELQAQGKTLLITSHIYETLTATCHQIHHLTQAKIQNTYQKEAYHQLKEILQTEIIPKNPPQTHPPTP
jgi:ABC-2 type transport system ATP-binding protein